MPGEAERLERFSRPLRHRPQQKTLSLLLANHSRSLSGTIGTVATFLPASRTMSSVSAGRVSDSFVKHFRWRIPGYETNRLVEPALFVGRKFSSRKVNLDSKLLQ